MKPTSEGSEIDDGAAKVGATSSRLRILVVSSVGGHLREILLYRMAFEEHEVRYVVNCRAELPREISSRTTLITHSERDWRTLVNFWEAWRILGEWRPDLLVSSGAGPIVPFAMAGRLKGIPTLYLESLSSTKPSLTGRIMYRLGLARWFLIQWEAHRRYFPKGQYVGLPL